MFPVGDEPVRGGPPPVVTFTLIALNVLAFLIEPVQGVLGFEFNLPFGDGFPVHDRKFFRIGLPRVNRLRHPERQPAQGCGQHHGRQSGRHSVDQGR